MWPILTTGDSGGVGSVATMQRGTASGGIGIGGGGGRGGRGTGGGGVGGNRQQQESYGAHHQQQYGSAPGHHHPQYVGGGQQHHAFDDYDAVEDMSVMTLDTALQDLSFSTHGGTVLGRQDSDPNVCRNSFLSHVIDEDNSVHNIHPQNPTWSSGGGKSGGASESHEEGIGSAPHGSSSRRRNRSAQHHQPPLMRPHSWVSVGDVGPEGGSGAESDHSHAVDGSGSNRSTSAQHRGGGGVHGPQHHHHQYQDGRGGGASASSPPDAVQRSSLGGDYASSLEMKAASLNFQLAQAKSRVDSLSLDNRRLTDEKESLRLELENAKVKIESLRDELEVARRRNDKDWMRERMRVSSGVSTAAAPGPATASAMSETSVGQFSTGSTTVKFSELEEVGAVEDHPLPPRPLTPLMEEGLPPGAGQGVGETDRSYRGGEDRPPLGGFHGGEDDTAPPRGCPR